MKVLILQKKLASYWLYGNSRRAENSGGDSIPTFMTFLERNFPSFKPNKIATPLGKAFLARFNRLSPESELYTYDINPRQLAVYAYQIIKYAKNACLVDAGYERSFSPYLASIRPDLLYISNIPTFLSDNLDQAAVMAQSIIKNNIPLVGGSANIQSIRKGFEVFASTMENAGYIRSVKPKSFEFIIYRADLIEAHTNNL